MIRPVQWYRNMKQERTQKWDSHCSRCGLCCHEKTIIGKEVVYDLDQWCEHFDPITRTCRVYAKRLTEHVRCRPVTVFRAMFATYLPPECGYVRWAEQHHLRLAPYRRIHYVRDGEEDTAALLS